MDLTSNQYNYYMESAMLFDKKADEELHQLVCEKGHFAVSLGNWILPSEKAAVMKFRSDLRLGMIAWLAESASQAFIYDCECIKHVFSDGEYFGLNKIISPNGSIYKLNLDQIGIFKDFPDFWGNSIIDSVNGKLYSSGSIVFLIDNADFEYCDFFSKFRQIFVHSNQASILGRSLVNRVKKYGMENPNSTAVIFLAGAKFMIFPGENVKMIRLAQAVEAVYCDEQLHYSMADGGLTLRHDSDGAPLIVADTGSEQALATLTKMGLVYDAERGGYPVTMAELDDVFLALRPYIKTVEHL